MTGIVKRKGRYLFAGLPASGKSLLVEYLMESDEIEAVPYPDQTNCRCEISECDYILFSCVQACGRSLGSCYFWVWIMQARPHYYICSRMTDWRSMYPHYIQVSFHTLRTLIFKQFFHSSDNI